MFAVIKSKALSVTRCSSKHVDFAVQMHPDFTSLYSASVGKSIQTSANNLESQNVGCTGPMRQAKPPLFTTRYASLMPRCGSGQYSMLPADTYLSNPSVGRGRSSASPYRTACILMTLCKLVSEYVAAKQEALDTPGGSMRKMALYLCSNKSAYLRDGDLLQCWLCFCFA